MTAQEESKYEEEEKGNGNQRGKKSINDIFKLSYYDLSGLKDPVCTKENHIEIKIVMPKLQLNIFSVPNLIGSSP